MNAPFNTPQRVADELLRVDRARRVRIVQATDEAATALAPLTDQRASIEAAVNHLRLAEAHGARLDCLIESADLALADLQTRIDQELRDIALRHRLFVDDDATEDFDEVEVDAILPAAEAARRQMAGRGR